MSKIPQFAAYAAAFEEAYATDDWAPLEHFFATDAVYDVGLTLVLGDRFEGRDAILAYFKAVLDGFDRRFASRELALIEGPTESGQTVSIRGSATYRADGVPDLVLVLDEFVTFDGDRIVHLEDRYDDPMKQEIADYLEAHGDSLGIARDAGVVS